MICACGHGEQFHPVAGVCHVSDCPCTEWRPEKEEGSAPADEAEKRVRTGATQTMACYICDAPGHSYLVCPHFDVKNQRKERGT